MFYKGVIHRRRRQLIIFITLILTWIAILNSDLSPDFYFMYWETPENISCYNTNENDVLQSAENRGFSPPSNSIFFHETSCKGALNSRQACAVEAAATANPHWEVYVLFTAPIPKIDGSLQVFQDLRNVQLARIHITEYAKETPLENFVSSGRLNQTRWKISHASDVLRYLTLFKWGGVYLDLDTVMVKSVDTLEKNWAARESADNVAAGALCFSRDQTGRSVAGDAIRDLINNFRGDIWGHNGPGVVTRVLKKRCETHDVTTMSASSCKGFAVYGPELFYPIGWLDANKYFEPGEPNNPDAYVYHAWNRLTQNYKVPTNSLYVKLAKKYCPNVYQLYINNFGV